MKTLMDYIKEEARNNKKPSKAYQNKRKVDVCYYHGNVETAFASIGVLLTIIGITTWVAGIICNDVIRGFTYGSFSLLIGGFHARFLCDWRNELRFKVINDTTDVLFCACPRDAENLPRDTELIIYRYNIWASGVVEIRYNGRKGYININKLQDVTVYKD